MPRGMWWLGHHPWFAETGIRGLESKASRHGGLFNETYSSGGGIVMLATAASLSQGPSNGGGALKCAEVGLRSAENRAPQRVWEVLARILEENPFPLGANIQKSPSFDSLWSKGNP